MKQKVMKKRWQSLLQNNKVLFVTILLLALFMRTVFLDRVPTGVSNDELDYILNAKSLFLSGSDISHTWNPLTLTAPKSSFPQGEIAPLLTFWLIGPLPFSLFTSKLIYALFATGTVALIMLITQKLIGKYEAYFAGLVAAYNPWLIFFGRTAYDTPLAIFFFLLGIYVLLIAKRWKILFAFIPFFIGFYAYIGTKLLFLPVMLVTTFFAWKNNKHDKIQYMTLIAVSVLFFTGYTLFTLNTPGTRIKELATPNIEEIKSSVNAERKLSIHTPLTTALSNKYVLFGKYATEKYFNAFSPNFLFLYGDGKSLFTLWYHGVFYYLDALFLIIGFVYLWGKYRNKFYLLALLAIIAPLPSVLSTQGLSYAIRSMLLAPVFIIVIGIGIAQTVRKNKLAGFITAGVYILLILNFINIYFFRNPIYNSQSFNFGARELAKYLSLQNGNVFVINGDPKSPLKEYLFYNNALDQKSDELVAKSYTTNKFIFNRIHFITCQQINEIIPGSVVIYDTCKNLPKTNNEITITQLSDGGRIYTIQNDTVCSQYNLSRYPYGITFADLQIENLPAKEFCEKFISLQK